MQHQRACQSQQIASGVDGILVLDLSDVAVVIDAHLINCVLASGDHNWVPQCMAPENAPCKDLLSSEV